MWIHYMLNLQLPLVLSFSAHLPVGVFAFWTRHPGSHLDLNLALLCLLQLQHKKGCCQIKCYLYLCEQIPPLAPLLPTV